MLHQDSFHQQDNIILLGGNFIRVKLSFYVFYLTECTVPENVHTHPMKAHWKIPRGGG